MKILFATDGSNSAREGERLITASFDRPSPIHAFTVVPDPFHESAGDDPDLMMVRMDVPVFGGERVAGEAADRLTGEGFQASSSASRGNPGAEILRMVEEHDYDLVVLGASHTTWMGNVLMGSVSTYVMHHAPCSVLVTHRAPTGPAKVLIGFDGSEPSLASMRLAAKILDRSRCSIEVATVVRDPWATSVMYAPGPFLASTGDYRALEKERFKRGRALVEQGASIMREAGFEVSDAVLDGGAIHQLLKEADNISADLVVVGARGMGPLRRTFLGSVSDQLIRHAPATLVGREGAPTS